MILVSSCLKKVRVHGSLITLLKYRILNLQLSIYRQAAAMTLGVNPEQIQAVFYYVADQVVTTPTNLLSLDELTALIS